MPVHPCGHLTYQAVLIHVCAHANHYVDLFYPFRQGAQWAKGRDHRHCFNEPSLETILECCRDRQTDPEESVRHEKDFHVDKLRSIDRSV